MPKKTNFENSAGNRYYRTTAVVGKTPDGKPIRKQFYGISKRAAEEKRDNYLFNLNMGLSAGYDKLTFQTAFKAWFSDVLTPTLSLNSYARYERDYRLRIEMCSLSSMKLSEIKPIHVQHYYNYLMKDNTINTVRATNKLLSNFFRYCDKQVVI